MRSQQIIDSSHTPPSYTALAVLEGFCLNDFSYTKDFPDIVDENTQKWSKYLLASAKQAYPYSLSYLAISFFDIVPYSVSQFTYSKMGGTYYPQQIALRKKYITQVVNEAIEAGIKQVLYIGGGLDTMCLVQHFKHSDIHFFEIDRGKHRTIKCNALNVLKENTSKLKEGLGAELTLSKQLKQLAEPLYEQSELGKNLHFVEADMAQRGWHALLEKEGFDTSFPTLCIAEGFTPYLTLEQLDVWFQEMKQLLLHQDSKLLLSFVEPGKGQKSRTAEVTEGVLLKSTHETYQASLGRNEVPHYLYERGFMPKQRLTHLDMQAILNLVSEADRPKTAFLRENYYLSSIAREGDRITLEADIPAAVVNVKHLYYAHTSACCTM